MKKRVEKWNNTIENKIGLLRGTKNERIFARFKAEGLSKGTVYESKLHGKKFFF